MYTEYTSIKQELKNNYGEDEKQRQRKLDLLKYQFDEIDKANLKIGEDEKLEADRKIILNSEKINENLNIADMEISEKTIDSINSAIRALEKIEDLDEEYSRKLNSLKSVYYDVQELGRDIFNLKESVYFDEEERQNLESRIDLIFSLKRKYGNTIDEILNYKKELEQEIYRIENLEENNNILKNKLKVITEKMNIQADKLNEIRNKFAKKLEESINKELKDLEMKNASVFINVQKNQSNEFNCNGLDHVEFLIKTNIGEDAKPLYKIASGGEMSRIMLGIKNVLSNVDNVPVLIFDEIDTGISGIAAKSVGEKLKSIAKLHQVLCVTHLASIAAKGEYNYYIHKEVENEKTYTNIKLLNQEEKIREVARIASGDINSTSLEHANSLICSE